MTTELAHCRNAVDAIAPDAPVDVVIEAIALVDGVMARIRELKAELEARVVERIKASGEFAIGETRYYVGTPKVTKCRDQRAAVEAILEATGGDFGRLCECLASGAIKHGAARTVLEDAGAAARFDELFEVTRDEVLAEGKLQKADKRFLK